MKKWVLILIITLITIILLISLTVIILYNKYSAEIATFSALKQDADILFNQGVTGPNDCDSFTRCIKYCVSNDDSCIQFCEDNPQNELCTLITNSIENEKINLTENSYSEE